MLLKPVPCHMEQSFHPPWLEQSFQHSGDPIKRARRSGNLCRGGSHRALVSRFTSAPSRDCPRHSVIPEDLVLTEWGRHRDGAPAMGEGTSILMVFLEITDSALNERPGDRDLALVFSPQRAARSAVSDRGGGEIVSQGSHLALTSRLDRRLCRASDDS